MVYDIFMISCLVFHGFSFEENGQTNVLIFHSSFSKIFMDLRK